MSRRPIEASESPLLVELANELRSLRAIADLSQREVAEAARLSTRQYERIEGAKRRTRPSTLRHIVDALLAREDDDTRQGVYDELLALAASVLGAELKNPERRFKRYEKRRRRKAAILEEAMKLTDEMRRRGKGNRPW
jgi:transcriptional regulator with XRE-family HTH domain